MFGLLISAVAANSGDVTDEGVGCQDRFAQLPDTKFTNAIAHADTNSNPQPQNVISACATACDVVSALDSSASKKKKRKEYLLQ